MSDPAVSESQAEIEDILGMVQTVMGDTFSVEELLAFVQLYRRRPLYFKVFRPPPDWGPWDLMGVSFAAADQDVILVEAGLDDVLFYSTVGHESGHVLANHVRTIDSTLEQLIHNPEELAGHLQLSEYEESQDEKEFVADELGILFAECLIRHACLIPNLAGEIYGND